MSASESAAPLTVVFLGDHGGFAKETGGFARNSGAWSERPRG
jgi:hypothetical protein